MIRIAPGLLAAALVLVACGGQPGTAPQGSFAAPDASIAAAGIEFDRATLRVPAGRAFRLDFENREGAPHNVAIVDATGAVAFRGEVFGGPATRQYLVPALTPGIYRFLCDVHPDMAGELTAG